MIKTALGTLESESAARLGRYELVATLGEGAFGSVYQAVDPDTGQEVALKELHRKHADAVVRFKREFRTLQDIHHENLVRLDGLFEHNGSWVIAMELIRGTDLLTWVRGPADNDNQHVFDEGRLRSALSALADGLDALHRHGVVHRDLKPSNILVTAEGRLVLLDFGLVTPLDPNAQSTQAGMVGTAAYMAPEQASGRTVGPAADCYALGTCLYEALTGELPFAGESVMHLLMRKHQGPVPRATNGGRVVPADLDELCVRLLDPNPETRATTRDLREAFGGQDLDQGGAFSIITPSLSTAFTGREAELHHIDEAFEQTQRGALRILLIEGESGVGKSALVGEFLRQKEGRGDGPLVLKSRCYENEQAAYKAFDGAMEDLARALKKLPSADCAALLPKRAVVLAQVFPGLSSVPTIKRAPMLGISADHTARRLEAFEALSDLLANLSVRRPLVLVVDDLQWADSESFRLLRALVEHSRAVPILILGTVRPRIELDAEVAEELELVRNWSMTQVLPISGLPRSQARGLASDLLGPSAPQAWLYKIADESRGHPLFIAALASYASSHNIGESGSLTLEAALSARIRGLSRDARTLLELVALSGRPVSQVLLAQAQGRKDLRTEVNALLEQQLIRRRRSQQLVCFHDRIREVTVSLIARVRRPELHRALAISLDAAGIEPAERARHWDAAGAVEQARKAYEQAADSALEALAFARAEKLYARALELVEPGDTARVHRLRVARGHAFARGGRSAEAARVFQEAAQGAQGEERTRLRVAVAQHLLQSAQVSEGLEAARSLLQELDIALPRGTGAALSRVLWDRSWLRLSGLRVRIRPDGEVPKDQRLVLDALSALAFPVSSMDLLTGAMLGTQHLRRSLHAGDRGHLVRALLQEASMRAMQAPEDRLAREGLIEQAERLIRESDDPALHALRAFILGVVAASENLVGDAVRFEQEAEGLYAAHCQDDAWHLTNVRMTLGGARYLRGDHGVLASSSTRWLAEADERRDLMARTVIVGFGMGAIRHLLADDPDAGVCEVREAIERWPRESYSLSHVGAFLANGACELYRGGVSARAYVGPEAVRFAQSFLGKTNVTRAWRCLLSGQAALGAYRDAAASERRGLLAEARTAVRGLHRGIRAEQAALVEAQCLALEGRTDAALGLLRKSRAASEARELIYQHPAKYLEGRLEGGEAGEEKCAAALAFFAQQGYRKPLRALAMLAPAIDALEATLPTRVRKEPNRIGGRYEVLGSLGEGGFGSVVEARDHRTGERVALKELVSASASALLGFKHEFRAMQELHHPNLVRLDALLEHEGRCYIAMECVPGTDFLSWVRPQGKGLDELRLREILLCLTDGLQALHDAGFVHRDVHPHNVRVTPDGRAVLLDFGLISLGSEHEGEAGAGLGSPTHMAPEQVHRQEVTPAADWYAVGSCLYEALTGRPPFEARLPILVMQAKQASLPEPPSRVVGSGVLPPDLERLCMRLIDPDPERRADAAEVRAVLGPRLQGRASPPPGHSAVPGHSIVQPANFKGREAELALLEAALARAVHGSMSVLFVEGDSGIGKSALVDELLRRVRNRGDGARVFKSRCYENEQLAYKALDGAIDELARWLRRLPSVDSRKFLPPRAALLPMLFSVLGSVPSIAAAPHRGIAGDPSAQRLEAFESLRVLLANISRDAPLVIAIDDLQWADAESFRLLSSLAEHRMELPLLIVCTVRPRDQLGEETTAALDHLAEVASAEHIALRGLPDAQARVLARQLLGTEVSPSCVDAVVHESQGHPLFIAELCRYALATHGAAPAAVRYEDALRARVSRLSRDARDLLEIILLAERPHDLSLLTRALGRQDLAEAATCLLADKLVRRRSEHGLMSFHDRIRTVLTQDLSERRRVELHGRLAAILDRFPGADPAERARHWDLCGNADCALDAYEEAAGLALETLAFNRADRLYARALELVGGDRPRWLRLTVARAHALARGGHSADAAQLYQDAAPHAEGELRMRLQIWAAQHLLQSAQVERGLAIARALLSELGVPLPRGESAVLSRIVWDRTCLRAGGMKLAERGAEELPLRERLALSAVDELAFPISMVDLLPGVALNTRHMRRAFKLGERTHAARALLKEAVAHAVQHPTREVDTLAQLERAHTLVQECGDPRLAAFELFARGVVDRNCGRTRSALSLFEQAEQCYRERFPDETWLLSVVRGNLGACLYALGEYRGLRAKMTAWREQAQARSDQFAFAQLTTAGMGFTLLLMDDTPDLARQAIITSIEPWPLEPFSMMHLQEFESLGLAELYRGGSHGAERLELQRERHETALLFKAAGTRWMLHFARHQAALAALSSAPQPADPKALKRLNSQAARLLRDCAPAAAPGARLAHAQLTAITLPREDALKRTSDALAQIQESETVLRYAADYLLGRLRGKQSGHDLCREALDFFATQGWRNPSRALAASGLPLIELLDARLE